MHEIIYFFLTPDEPLNPAPNSRLMFLINILKAEMVSRIDFLI
jgi:hypothetical protein